MDNQAKKMLLDEDLEAVAAIFGAEPLDGPDATLRREREYFAILEAVLETEQGRELKSGFLASKLTREEYKKQLYALVAAAKSAGKS